MMRNNKNRDIFSDNISLFLYMNNFLGRLSKLVKYVIILEENRKRQKEKIMEQYYWFILGTIFGLAIAVYFFVSREEKIENSIKLNQTKKLDNAMETVVDRIKLKIDEQKRELTEEEKNEIIRQCCKEKFNIQ